MSYGDFFNRKGCNMLHMGMTVKKMTAKFTNSTASLMRVRANDVSSSYQSIPDRVSGISLYCA